MMCRRLPRLVMPVCTSFAAVENCVSVCTDKTCTRSNACVNSASCAASGSVVSTITGLYRAAYANALTNSRTLSSTLTCTNSEVVVSSAATKSMICPVLTG